MTSRRPTGSEDESTSIAQKKRNTKSVHGISKGHLEPSYQFNKDHYFAPVLLKRTRWRLKYPMLIYTYWRVYRRQWPAMASLPLTPHGPEPAGGHKGRPQLNHPHHELKTMPIDFPYAADAEMSLSFDELVVLQRQYEKEQELGHVSSQTKFNYAWGLVKSPNKEQQVEGVGLLQDLYRAEPSRRRECLYYLALGYYKLGNYEEARRFNELLIQKEPTNLQAQSLGSLIDKGLAREGYIGMALAGGAAALGTLIIAGMIQRASSRKH